MPRWIAVCASALHARAAASDGNVFRNRLVKEDGLWKIREMRVFPIFRSDYRDGWGKSRLDARQDRGAYA